MCLKLLTSNPKNRSASVCLTNYSFSKTQILFIASHKHYWCPYFWAQLSVRGPLLYWDFFPLFVFSWTATSPLFLELDCLTGQIMHMPMFQNVPMPEPVILHGRQSINHLA